MRVFFYGLTEKRCSRLRENACFLKMAFSRRRKRLVHDCMLNMLFSIAGQWKPMGVKSHWENKKQQENQDVETNGGEKPLGKLKKHKKYNVDTNGN